MRPLVSVTIAVAVMRNIKDKRYFYALAPEPSSLLPPGSVFITIKFTPTLKILFLETIVSL